ncbi:MAG: sensor histidine kinase [Hyphomicrobiales bacterium]|nr:sensor histidine kinase [Hyphomicrobiales bacterium]
MNSIRTRLLIWLMVPLSAVAAIVSLETFFSAQKASRELNDRTLLAAMLTLSENIVASSGTVLAENTLKILTENLGDQFYYYVQGPRGAFVTGYSRYPSPEGGLHLETGIPIFYNGEYNGVPVRVTAMRQFLSGRRINGLTTIIAWQQTSTRDALTLRLFVQSLLRLVLVVLAAGGIVWFAVSRGLRPIDNLQNAIDNRSPYDLNPIRRAMPIELKGIVGSMNELFGRVARSKRNREQFIGNAAHQLRNPIAAIKVQAQAALAAGAQSEMDAGLQQIVTTSDETARMINIMLSSASAQVLSNEGMKPFNLAKVVSRCAEAAVKASLEKGQEFSLDMQFENLTYWGSEILLGEAIANLIDNAIRHNKEEANISVSLQIDNDDRFVEIAVTDDGQPMDEEALIALSQPFSTGDVNSSGSGLGLSLAKDVAKSHGGYIKVRPTTPAMGKTIAIRLPHISA